MNEYVQTEQAETKKNPLRLLWLFLSEHWSLFLFGALAALAFLYSEKFAEFFYSLLRFVVIVVASMGLRDMWFKKTIRPYVNQEAFANDFKELPSEQKVWLSVIIMVALLFAATLSFIHP